MQTATRKEFYTAEEYAAAKSANIAAFLQQNGYPLTREGRDYKAKAHDSLVIREDGRWFWNSRGIGGKSPIELYKHILLNDYGYSDEITAAIAAVKQLAGGHGAYVQPAYTPKQEIIRPSDEALQLPGANGSASRVMAYLCKTRELDAEIVRELMRERKIYETRQSWSKETQRYENTPYSNAVFVAYDKQGRPQNAFLRGTISMTDKPFKKDVDNSDKSYPFTLSGRSDSDRVFCFESAIDAISHASIYKMAGLDWKDGHRISLGGTSFLGLERFLKDNSQVTAVSVCLDNDPTGNCRSDKLFAEFTEKGYGISREPPISKDFNQDLLDFIQQEKEDELAL